MELKTLSLSELNAQSEKKSFKLEDAELSRPSRELLWAPAELPPLCHLQELRRARAEERLRYNQLYALGVLEQFIWLESRILCRVIERVLKDRTLSSELRTGLGYFYDEEVKHSELFWRLLQLAEPALYPNREFHFLKENSLAIKAVESLVEAPSLFVVWVWMTIFFEERTLDFSKRYVLTDRRAPNTLDRSFVKVHKLHMQDELRHFMMDVHLLEKYYDNSHALKRRLACRMFKIILERLSNPKMMSVAYVAQLDKEFPGFSRRAGEALLKARSSLRENIEFRKVSMSSESTPRTYALLHKYDETRPLRGLFVEA
ncbi:MAG TPA: diiron oxygenase [Bdellovibrionales bacterium]|nr:diiron oxygenase [Bdellovibrionales bacterium]